MTQRSIEVEGLGHGGTPIPAACRVGPLLMSGGINGKDIATGKIPEDLDLQVRNAFANMKRILEAADMALTDVVKVTVFLADEGDRAAVNGPWTDAFPDPGQRPARHALILPLRGGARIQLEVTAYATEA